MARVHIGRMDSTAGVSRTVAIKRVHPHFASDPDFASMFFDEARLSLRIQHPNVVPTFDVVAEEGELLLVMDYVHGDSLASLWREIQKEGGAIPARIAAGIVGGLLAGLHAAHELRGEDGMPLGIVHRDVSPQNVLVGVDGVARVLDFGVAKAAGRLHSTEAGKVKGKIAYMAPEQLIAGPLDRRADVFAASVILWEALTGLRLFNGENPGAVAIAVLTTEIRPPSTVNTALDPAIDRVVMTGLSRQVEGRYESAEAMAIDLEQVIAPASPRTISEWVQRLARDRLASRARFVAEVETDTGVLAATPSSGIPVSEAEDVPSELVGPAGKPAEQSAATLASSTVTTVPQDPAARKARSLRAVAFGVAALTLCGFGVILHATAGGSSTSSGAVVLPEPTGVPSAIPSSSSEPAAPDTSARTTDAAPEGPIAQPPTTATPSLPPVASHAPTRATPKPPQPKPSLDCTNPFVVRNGIRVPRPECFKN
jgi:serine/threonine-protein kinase